MAPKFDLSQLMLAQERVVTATVALSRLRDAVQAAEADLKRANGVLDEQHRQLQAMLKRQEKWCGICGINCQSDHQ